MTRVEWQTVVVGGGVIGLACARALARAGRSVLLLEGERALGQHTSSRNSEVIHAGFYAAPDTLKATLCVEGRALLTRYCEERGVAYRLLGKLVVATRDDDLAKLEALRDQGRRCGVTDLELLDADAVRAREPALRATGALLSPSSGIVDSHALLQALRADAVDAGATVVLGSAVTRGATLSGGGFELEVRGADDVRVRCTALVNAAGHGAAPLARALEGLDAAFVPRTYFAIGHYYALRGPSPFSHLVYPLAPPGSLGIHVTLDLAGACRFGPDIRYRDALDYAFDDSEAARFADAIRAYYPALADDALVPAMTGVRPKLHGPDEPVADFRIDGPALHGVPGLVNLFGIESPGLTAALAIAERVRALVK